MTGMGELHVVFGTGPVGLAVVNTLIAQGKRVRVVSRSGARRSLPETLEVVRGDATHREDTRQVRAGASHVYQCTNAPDYHRWRQQFPPLQRGILAGAAVKGVSDGAHTSALTVRMQPLVAQPRLRSAGHRVGHEAPGEPAEVGRSS